jgi:hypothetical protein
MSTILGLLSLLVCAGLTGYLALDGALRRREDGDAPTAETVPDERRRKLLDGLDREIRALHHRRTRRMATVALLALLLAIFFFSMRWLLPIPSAQTSSGVTQQKAPTNLGTGGTNSPGGGIASLLNAAAVPWFGFASLLVIAGSCLLIFGKGSKLAKGAGAATLAAGLLSHVYLIKDLKIDKIFDIENKINLEADFEAYLNGRGWSGVESYPPIVPFVKGERYLADTVRGPDSAATEPRDIYLAKRFRSLCDSVTLHQRAPTLIMIIGTTDRSRLRGDAIRTFESNFGLARARAEWVREQWETWARDQGSGLPKECQIEAARFLTLGAGPLSTPNWHPGTSDSDPPDDRQVDILAFWSGQKNPDGKPSFGFHLGHEIELNKKEDKEGANKKAP